MLEGSLRFTIVVEAKLVDRGVVDRPGMAEVLLLESLVGDGSETGYVRAGSLKLRKGRDYVVIIEIIVEAKVLFVIEPVIESHGELVAAVRLHRYGLDNVAPCRRSRNKLKQIYSGGVHTLQGNDVVWKDVGVVGTVSDRNRMSSDIASGLLTKGALADLSSR